MSDPVPLSFPNCPDHVSFLSHQPEDLLIRLSVWPDYLTHFPPHFEGLQPIYLFPSRGPCFTPLISRTIKIHWKELLHFYYRSVLPQIGLTENQTAWQQGFLHVSNWKAYTDHRNETWPHGFFMPESCWKTSTICTRSLSLHTKFRTVLHL